MVLLQNISLRFLIPIFWAVAFFAPMTFAQESPWALSPYRIGADMREADINLFLGNDAVVEDDFGNSRTLFDSIGLYASPDSSVAQESPWDLPAYRIGADVSEANINLFLGDDLSIDTGSGTSTPVLDPFGLHASAYSSVGVILDESVEVGFSGFLSVWALNENASNEFGQGSFAGFGIENVKMHARFYFEGLKPHAGFVPWWQVGFGGLSHVRIGLGFEEDLVVGNDHDLVDSPLLQIGEFDFALDLSLGGSYRLSPYSSLDIEMAILGIVPTFEEDTESSVILADFDPSLHVGFSVWF